MRYYYRNKLDKLLGSAGNEEYIQLLWATHALQSDYSKAAQGFIQPETIPDGAITTNMTSKYFIQKWEIETLANELMTVPKLRTSKNGRTKTLRWDHYHSSAECVNWLRQLENSEYRIQKKKEDIFVEMGRIASRQFVWQQGFVNIPQFYRNAFVYGQGKCAAYFESRHGITPNRFSQIGFMLYASFKNHPVVQASDFGKALGVTWDEVERVLALISLPFGDASKLGQVQRRNIIHTADRPSVLRQAPCLRFGDQGQRIRAPLPELIVERITSGVFYDIVGGGHPIREDYGRRFEEYCLRYLCDMLPNYKWEPEFGYRKAKMTFDTPDVLCSEGNKLEIVIECKATRMSHEAMFGKNPIVARGYEDISKAIFQLWRFFSHCRRGYTRREVSDSAVGVVLTLDNWLVSSGPLSNQVFEDAAKLANKKDPDIIDVDRKPIVFVAISELERTLSIATEATFKEALSLANSERFKGWRLDSIHSEILGNDKPKRRDYPYADSLGALLPWWDELG